MDKQSFSDRASSVAMRLGNTQGKSQEAVYTPPKQVGEPVDAPPALPSPPPPHPPPSLPRPSTFDLSKVSTRPRVVKWVKPKYTDAAQDAEVEGVVQVEVVLDPTGKPIIARIVKGLGHGLDEAVKAAVLKSRFTPCQVFGSPVQCRLIIPNRFSLN